MEREKTEKLIDLSNHVIDTLREYGKNFSSVEIVGLLEEIKFSMLHNMPLHGEPEGYA